jgi:hypothetical protein
MTVVFLGCKRHVGHHYYINNKPHVDLRAPKGCPWPLLDSKEMSDPYGFQGEAWLHHKGFWTALGICDRSVDSRPNSRSVFAVDTPLLSVEGVLQLVRLYHGNILNRIGPIKLTKVVDNGVERPPKESDQATQ